MSSRGGRGVEEKMMNLGRCRAKFIETGIRME